MSDGYVKWKEYNGSTYISNYSFPEYKQPTYYNNSLGYEAYLKAFEDLARSYVHGDLVYEWGVSKNKVLNKNIRVL
jgi:hypothetical protein